MCFKTKSLNFNDRKDDRQTSYPDEVIRSAGLRKYWHRISGSNNYSIKLSMS